MPTTLPDHVRAKAAAVGIDGFAVEDAIGVAMVSVSFFSLFDYIAQIFVG